MTLLLTWMSILAESENQFYRFLGPLMALTKHLKRYMQNLDIVNTKSRVGGWIKYAPGLFIRSINTLLHEIRSNLHTKKKRNKREHRDIMLSKCPGIIEKLHPLVHQFPEMECQGIGDYLIIAERASFN